MTAAKKSPNCKTQAARLDAREVGALLLKGQPLVMTDLASYLFRVHGSDANGIHSIAALNHGSASARGMARQILRGKLPRGITTDNAATIAWMELRAEAHADAQAARPMLHRYIDGVCLRAATRAELSESDIACNSDGGYGVIRTTVRGERIDCYVLA